MQKTKLQADKQNIFLYLKCLPEWHPVIDAHAKFMRFKKNQILFSEGDPVEGIYFMTQGVAKVHKQWGADKELIVRFAKEKDIIGHRGLSTGYDTYPITATALTEVTVCFISLDFFNTTFRFNPEFAQSFMMFFADELRLSEQRMHDLVHLPVKARTAKALLNLKRKFGANASGYLSFTLSRQDISSYIGAAYESVYKQLLEFEEAELLKTRGKEIALRDISALEKLAAG